MSDPLTEARGKLAAPERRIRWLATLAASAFAAVASLVLAATVILGPGWEGDGTAVAATAVVAER